MASQWGFSLPNFSKAPSSVLLQKVQIPLCLPHMQTLHNPFLGSKKWGTLSLICTGWKQGHSCLGSRTEQLQEGFRKPLMSCILTSQEVCFSPQSLLGPLSSPLVFMDLAPETIDNKHFFSTLVNVYPSRNIGPCFWPPELQVTKWDVPCT